ncbi:ferrochelatase [Heterostelium album PN500]|uniref:Ferrochelatase n=1 Tax=Heterostelium pallidum (strain ATCC 26659 / Pp 5 / PN500) TaxID=670386 RepID=D3BUX7_HETP5|nr:ferrochelatase [Heterostelium album PN500]EFA74915.1 ferrochelatase [Heterostelium album PN500]|eukprot:XP_020427049.1 ferrochelatase [Heterostelium album PN500]
MLKSFILRNHCNNLTNVVRSSLVRYNSSSSSSNSNNKNESTTNIKPKTAIVMLNLGGPAKPEDVEPFLTRLFSDRDIFKLPFQKWAGKFIAKRRSPAVRKLYEAIGGGSPIRMWTERQGTAMAQQLDRLSPSTAPHKFYIGFRYADPLIDETLDAMKHDGVERAIAFTQYPHFSCTTTGSSLNNLWKSLESKGMDSDFQWSIIDRWHLHDGFIDAVASKVSAALARYKVEAGKIGDQTEPVVVFSAHSLPMRTVERGDPYPNEVAATVAAVINKLGGENAPQHMLCWQSKVGPLPWLVPKTSDTIERLAKSGRNAIVVPIAFTSDHIETLSEIDIELQHLAKENGMKLLLRSESLNDDPKLTSALADIVLQHMKSGKSIQHHNQYKLKCPGCIDETGHYCRTIRNPIVL